MLMPREKAGFRETLEILREMFPGRIAISSREAAAALGRNQEVMERDKNYPMHKVGGRNMVSLVDLARWI